MVVLSSLAAKSPQTHGTNYKYQGSYLDLFEIMRQFIPSYKVESLKLFKLLVFNYLFSNGDAHFKQFQQLALHAGIPEKQTLDILSLMVSKTELVQNLIAHSFLKPAAQRSYLQSYQAKLKKLK